MYLQNIIIPVYCRDENYEDEIFSDADQASFESMMGDFSNQNEDVGEAMPMPTCPFASAGGDQAFGVPSIAGVPGMAGIDPLLLANVLMKIVDTLEIRVKEAMLANESNVCSQIDPIQIFLSKNPYLDVENIFTNEEGVDALNKIKLLRAEVNAKMPTI